MMLLDHFTLIIISPLFPDFILLHALTLQGQDHSLQLWTSLSSTQKLQQKRKCFFSVSPSKSSRLNLILVAYHCPSPGHVLTCESMTITREVQTSDQPALNTCQLLQQGLPSVPFEPREIKGREKWIPQGKLGFCYQEEKWMPSRQEISCLLLPYTWVTLKSDYISCFLVQYQPRSEQGKECHHLNRGECSKLQTQSKEVGLREDTTAQGPWAICKTFQDESPEDIQQPLIRKHAQASLILPKSEIASKFKKQKIKQEDKRIWDEATRL